MKLYTFFRSSAAYRVRIALNLKGAAYESISKQLRTGEHRRADYLALNPQGLVPALEHDSVVLTQSLAIIEYLDELIPDPPLLPAGAVDRAKVRGIAQHIACDIHPLNNLRVLNHLRDDFGQGDTEVAKWYQHWIAEGLAGLEVTVKKMTADGLHCFGSRMTLADVLLVPQISNARRFNCDLSPYPTLVTIATCLEALPAFAAARPEVQPDAR